MKYKVWDIVLLPRFWNFNRKYDRDIPAEIKEIRVGRLISYRIGNKWYLEDLLRPTNNNTFTLITKIECEK